MNNISSEPYISGYTFRTISSQGVAETNATEFMREACPALDVNKVKEGDLLYVAGTLSRRFFVDVAPKIEVNFSVVTSQWDDGVDESFVDIIPEHLDKWWVINANIIHPKIYPIPLGLQNLHWRCIDNIQSNPATYEGLADREKLGTVISSFSVRNNQAERASCMMATRHLPDVTYRGFEPKDRENFDFVREYFEEAANHKFVLCPWGAGKDTHRMWEALYMGCIPITRKCTAFRDFEDYPIVFLDEWEELEGLDLDTEFEIKSAQLKKEDRIYFDYWKEALLTK